MKYRIVTDAFSGYEVQVRRWWFPFWLQCGGTNTHASIDKAEAYAKRYAERMESKKVVKELGDLSS